MDGSIVLSEVSETERDRCQMISLRVESKNQSNKQAEQTLSPAESQPTWNTSPGVQGNRMGVLSISRSIK